METDSGCFGIIEEIISSVDQINQINKDLSGKFCVLSVSRTKCVCACKVKHFHVPLEG